MSDLKKRTVSSVMWSTIRTVVGLITSPLLLILKARYLSPAEYGVMSILNLFLALVTVIENTGINKAIIQRDNITENEKSSLLIFQLIVGIFLAMLLIILTPFISGILEINALKKFLPILSVTIVISAPILILSSFLEKEIRFKELSLIQIIRSIALLISTAICFVVFDMGLLGVVLGQVISSIVGLVLIIIVAIDVKLISFKKNFKIAEVIPFLKFGISIAGKQVLFEITMRLDEMIIGYYFSAETLGYYYFAKNTIAQLRAVVSGAVSKVLFPLLSKFKTDTTQLKRLYHQITEYLGLIAFPLFIGLVSTSYLFIPLLFGKEWLASNIFFIIIAIASIPNFLITNLASSLLYTLDKPSLVFSIELVANGLYITLLLIVSITTNNLFLILGTYVLYLIFKPVVLQYYTNRYLNMSFNNYALNLRVPLISSLIMGIIIIVIQYTLRSLVSGYTLLILCIVTGIIVYIGVYLLLDKETIYDVVDLIADS